MRGTGDRNSASARIALPAFLLGGGPDPSTLNRLSCVWVRAHANDVDDDDAAL